MNNCYLVYTSFELFLLLFENSNNNQHPKFQLLYKNILESLIIGLHENLSIDSFETIQSIGNCENTSSL